MAKKRLFSLSRTMRVVLYRRRESATFCNAHWSSNASTPFRLIGAQCLNSFSAAKTPVHRKCQTHVTDFGYSILASNRSQTKTPLENLHMLISWTCSGDYKWPHSKDCKSVPTYQLLNQHQRNSKFEYQRTRCGPVICKKTTSHNLPLTKAAKGGFSINEYGGATSSEVLSRPLEPLPSPTGGRGTQRCESKTCCHQSNWPSVPSSKFIVERISNCTIHSSLKGYGQTVQKILVWPTHQDLTHLLKDHLKCKIILHYFAPFSYTWMNEERSLQKLILL